MSTIANIYTGNSINETEKQRKYVGLSDGYNYIATKDVSFEHAINYENGVKIPYSESNFRIAYKNTPLLCIEGGSAGRKIAILEQEVCFGNKLCAFQSLGVNPKYLYYYLQNPLFIQVFKSKTTGIIGGVSVNTLKTLIFALPPLTEQERIVKEIERFEPLLMEYDRLENQTTKLDSEIYDKLKKSILQYAIQGKLVEQDKNDESASILLERIRAEKKAKLGKKYVESYIYKGDDNCYYEKVGKNEPVLVEDLPFDIPDSWSWTRLGNIVDFENGDRSQKYPIESDYVPFGIPFWGAKDIINNKLTVTSNLRYISQEKFNELNNGKLRDRDFICLLRGAVGKWATFNVTKTIKTGFINAQMVIIRSNNLDSIEWLKTYFSSPFFTNLCDKYTSGTAVAQMSAKDLSKFFIPIPPQTEQWRICIKIKAILNRIEKDEN